MAYGKLIGEKQLITQRCARGSIVGERFLAISGRLLILGPEITIPRLSLTLLTSRLTSLAVQSLPVTEDPISYREIQVDARAKLSLLT